MGAEDRVINISDHKASVEHDIELLISTGSGRKETKWKNRKIRWSQLLAKLQTSQGTAETHAEYMKLPKERQDEIKDIGGFVGGHLDGGRRKNGSVKARQILTLDADFAPAGFWDRLCDLQLDQLDAAMCIYSTHKHSAEKPRFRLIMPISRPVSPTEYEAIGRKVAEAIGIDWFDDTTYQPTRLMYWPSHSADVDPVFEYYDAPVLDADAVLARYHDWTDTAEWPESSRMDGIRRKLADKQGDPTEKKGAVGVFCRTYTVTEAIAKYLPGIYEPTATPGRYTYTLGSTAGGLVIYDDDRFAYSNHATDPISGQLCNAFDLIRIHKFGELDEDAQGKPMNRRPSWQQMIELVKEDDACRLRAIEERSAEAKEDFAEDVSEENDSKWKAQLELNGQMGIMPTTLNAALILKHDERLQEIYGNEMSRLINAGNVPWSRPDEPWRDQDDAQLVCWLAKEYGVEFPTTKLRNALLKATDERRRHPVREYLDSLPAWDGVERLDTILIRYLDADDNIYTREAIRKTLIAAVARIYEPGIKFDYMLVLIGPQGAGKSTLFTRLAVKDKWFSDSLKMDTMNKIKDAGEQLQGVWIMEIGEMSGMKKADIESVKSFVSRQSDDYRVAFGHYREQHPRQCVIVGSSNQEEGFLRDITGNRRFWPIRIRKANQVKARDLSADVVGQIWAEAKFNYDMGEDLILSKEAEALAEEAQREAMEQDDRQGLVEEYLERRLPEDWDKRDRFKRQEFYQLGEEGTEIRQTVSNIEIYAECFGGTGTRIDQRDSYAIAKIMAKIPGWKKAGKQRRDKAYGVIWYYRRTE